MLGRTQDFSCSATQNQKNLFERESQGVAEQKQSTYSTLTFCKGALKYFARRYMSQVAVGKQ
jgi:hypothetical protein